MRLSQKSILSNCDLILVRAPTGESVGSEYVTNFEPTDLPVGVTKAREYLDF
jgi:hypothetical protein